MDISVVIPAYNAGRFITRCLQSVNAQTLRPKEVIVVDDGSTDNTAALAGSMGARVVHQKNLGVSAARNNGIRRASSEWIAFLDADDLWLPDKLERQAACVGPDTVLAYTGHRTIDDHGVLSESTGNDVEQARRMVRHRSPFYTSTVLAKRDVLLENGGFREGLPTCEDWEMWAKIILKHGAMAVEPSPLVEYYVHPDSSSADPGRMLYGLEKIIDDTLLEGLGGLRRWMWKQRIYASQLCSAGLIARDNHLKNEIGYLLRSLASWPSIFWETRRYNILAVSVRNKYFRRYRKAMHLHT